MDESQKQFLRKINRVNIRTYLAAFKVWHFVLQTHYVISEGQTELDDKQDNTPPTTTEVNTDPLEQASASQQSTTQYVIKTTTNGSGASEVQITKP